MKENQVSRTALITAYYRGYHAMHDTPKIFDDFLAYHLVPEKARATIEEGAISNYQLNNSASAASRPDQATALAWAARITPITPHIVSRARYTEDALVEAIRQGVQQYVILGAGMDTFAFRHPKMLEQLQVFEVDHPATQGFKRHRIAELGWKQPAQLHYVPVDFTQDSMAVALKRSSYDPQTLSFFSWLGVTVYLPQEAVFATLRDFADVSPAGSTIIFDYVDNDAFIPEKAASRIQVSIDVLRQLGEPWTTGFDPPTLATDLAPLGLRLQEDLNPSDIQERYFQGRTDGYYACEHMHFAWAVVE